MLCIRSAELIQVISKSLYPLTNISHLRLLSSPWQLWFYFVSMNLTFLDLKYKWDHIVFAFLSLTYFLSIMPWRSIHVMKITDFLLSHSWIILHCLHRPQLLYLFICQWILMCPCLVIVNNAAVNTVMHISLQDPIFISTGYIPRHEMTIICSSNYFFWGTFILFSIWLLQIIFPPKMLKCSLSPHLLQHLLFVVFW